MGWKFNPFTGKLDVFVGPPTGPAGGDLSGTYPNPTVDGLQGTPVSSATPYNGQVLQFDGTSWVPGSIPSGGSGGGGVVYFLNFNTAADAPVTNIPQTPNTSKELAIAVDTVATSYTSAHLPTASYAFLGSFVTDLNVPNATSIPAGLWDFNIYAQSSTTNIANQVYFKIEVLKYDGVNAPTLISTSGDTYIYDPTEVTQYVSSCIIPSGVTLTATDRLVVYLYGRAHQANKDITFHFGSTYPSHTHSTMPSVTGTGVVKVVNGVFQSPATTIVNADVSASAAIDVNKLAMSTNRLLGRTTAGTGAVEQITVGTGLSLSGGTLSSTVTAGVTSVTGTSPIASSGGTTPAISIADAVADGTTKGAAAFNASDFNSASGVISIDYTNGQSASASNKGFLASTDWTTFNNKIGTGAYTTQTGLTMNTSRLLGRTTASSGAAEEISVSGGALLSATNLIVHNQSHAMTSTSDHTAGNWKVFYSNGSGQVTELSLGAANTILTSNGTSSAPTFTAPAAGGTKTYAVFNANDNQPPAANFATLDTRNSIAILDFDDTTDESAIFLGIIPEAASLGSGLKIRLIWTAATATSGDCVWDASLEKMTTDIDTDSFDTAASVTTTTNGTSGVPNYSEITLTTIDSVVAGDGFRLKITRDANNGSDTMTGDAELIAVEVRSAA